MQTAWLSLWTIVVSTARRAFSSAPVRRYLEALSGTVLVRLGVPDGSAGRLALTHAAAKLRSSAVQWPTFIEWAEERVASARRREQRD